MKPPDSHALEPLDTFISLQLPLTRAPAGASFQDVPPASGRTVGRDRPDLPNGRRKPPSLRVLSVRRADSLQTLVCVEGVYGAVTTQGGAGAGRLDRTAPLCERSFGGTGRRHRLCWGRCDATGSDGTFVEKVTGECTGAALELGEVCTISPIDRQR